ncbi:MAG: peptidoglycan-binding domain-containing protein [Minisyncoccia bacterium]
MNKKSLAIVLSLFLPILVFAAVTDFTANSNITVSAVTFGAGSANMIIMNGSTAQSWLFSSGAFTVTNPGSAFNVASSDATVKSIQVTSGGTTLVCEANTTPGTSFATLPTASGTYTVLPSATTACTSLCTVLPNVATYNAFPTCGALSCSAGYQVSGSGASATCVPVGGGVPTSLLTCQVGYAFGQNSSGSWSCIPVVSTPITTTIAGCMPGYRFSATTGQSCSGTTIPGCLSGYLFSATTGQSCGGKTASLSINDTQMTGPSDGGTSAVFSKNLSKGMSSADVRRLQVLLASNKDVYPEGIVNGHYGPLTKKAVGRFQIKYGVVSSAKARGYGNVGPMTRAKLQMVFGN